jgi:hypothetical protein
VGRPVATSWSYAIKRPHAAELRSRAVSLLFKMPDICWSNAYDSIADILLTSPVGLLATFSTLPIHGLESFFYQSSLQYEP